MIDSCRKEIQKIIDMFQNLLNEGRVTQCLVLLEINNNGWASTIHSHNLTELIGAIACTKHTILNDLKIADGDKPLKSDHQPKDHRTNLRVLDGRIDFDHNKT